MRPWRSSVQDVLDGLSAEDFANWAGKSARWSREARPPREARCATLVAARRKTSLSRRVLESSLILIATPDAEIAGVAAELARIGAEELQGRVVLHTSGALDASVLQPDS